MMDQCGWKMPAAIVRRARGDYNVIVHLGRGKPGQGMDEAAARTAGNRIVKAEEGRIMAASGSRQPFSGPGPDHSFRQKLAAGRFEIQRCTACSRYVFYPRALCPHCGAPDVVWTAPSGRGTVYSTTVVRRKPEQGGDYNVAIIELDEGPRLMSRVEGMSPEQVCIGLQVTARISGAGENAVLVFVPAAGRGDHA